MRIEWGLEIPHGSAQLSVTVRRTMDALAWNAMPALQALQEIQQDGSTTDPHPQSKLRESGVRHPELGLIEAFTFSVAFLLDQNGGGGRRRSCCSGGGGA